MLSDQSRMAAASPGSFPMTSLIESRRQHLALRQPSEQTILITKLFAALNKFCYTVSGFGSWPP